jgi:hypothetical protein
MIIIGSPTLSEDLDAGSHRQIILIKQCARVAPVS